MVDMQKETIIVLKNILASGEVTEAFIDELENDERSGVQKLLINYRKKQLKQIELKNKFIEMSLFENKQYALGKEFIAGIDEVGRGPLAGPVVAAAVILPKDFELLGLDDSKQLSAATREAFYEIITAQAISYEIIMIDNKQIDEVNIYNATKKAMYGAIKGLSQKPDHVLIDAMRLEGIGMTQESIIKGDEKSISIAAASVLAKVARDRFMQKLDEKYLVYKFSNNMGYGTKHHLEMIEAYGPTVYHRMSFAPMSKMEE